MQDSFIHLRLHSAYSLSQGAIKLPALYDLVKKNDMPGVAITDTNNMFGLIEFSFNAPKNGIVPILGTEISVLVKHDGKNYYKNIVLIAKTEKGYHNLIKLSSLSYTKYVKEEGFAYLKLSDFTGLTEDIICLSGGYNGPVGQLFLLKQEAKATEF
jgi:DNA polymerase-3 subunit alpha